MDFGSLLSFTRLGIQPSTGSSGRSRAEVQQDGAKLLLRRAEGLVDVLAPIHAHHLPPKKYLATTQSWSLSASWIERGPRLLQRVEAAALAAAAQIVVQHQRRLSN